MGLLASDKPYRRGHHRWAVMPERRKRLAYAGYDGHGIPIADEYLPPESGKPESAYLQPGELEEILGRLRDC